MAASPAAAASPPLCEPNGSHHLCVGAPSLANDSAVDETASGREVTFEEQGAGRIEIVVIAAPSECVAAANNGVDVVLHLCNSGTKTDVEWTKSDLGVQFRLRNVATGKFLAGKNTAGSQYQLKTGPTAGWDLVFAFRA